ncbi:MAG: hypothetical protein FJ387_30485 [Verrucomicrobia bacterium]|nr:hypothetical protein [Verrucomicrobiota bacterium]
MRIEQNLILLGRNTHLLADMDWMAGVLLYAEDSIPGGSRLKGITVARNFVRGDKITEGQTTYSALGVLLMLNSPIFESIHVNDNVLEVPDAAELNTAYENALVFSPTYRAVDPAAGVGGEVRAHGNRNLSGQDMRFKYQQYQQMSQWGPYSQRLARFKAPSFGGRAGVFYDEFMGALPRSALGWQGLTSGSGAAIAEQDGQAKRPGIARLSTGTDIAGLSELRYSSSSIVLGGGLTHLFGFAARRAQQSAYPTDFDCVLGLVASDSSNVGVYFKITSGGTYNNQWTAICTDTSQERVVGVSDFEYAPPPWRSFRIEVQADASAVEFLIDGKWFGRATSYLPTVPLFMILMIRNRSQPYHGANHDLLVDHFSHQVF